MKNRKRIIAALIAGLGMGAVIILFWLLSKDKISPGITAPEPEPAGKAIETVQAKIKTVTEYYNGVGTVQPRTQARIEARVPGQIKAVWVRAGEVVSEGQGLVVLDDRQMKSRLSQARQSLQGAISQKAQARQAINSAQAAYAEAQSAYQRTKAFFEAEAAAETALEKARSHFFQAEAALKRAKDGFSGASAAVRMSKERVREAEIALGYTNIKAPADGKILKRLADPGDQAMPGKPLLLMRTESGLRLEAFVRESLIQKVWPSALLRVELPSLQKTVDAEVEELIPYADPKSRSFLVKARLPDMPGLYPGMYGKLLIPHKTVDVILIPGKAVDAVGQLELVTVKTPDGWERRYIKTGDIYGDQVEVLSGLSGTEVLKTKGPADDE